MDQPLPALAEAEQAVLKDHVIEKLKKLDLFTDDVLPQYICVMVKNRKSPKEMVEQLNFVLGEDTDEFVQWLRDVVTSGDLKTSNKRAADGPADADQQKRAKTATDGGGKEEKKEESVAPADPPSKRPCQFYPNCRNGAGCPFVHPDPALLSREPRKHCMNFPTCQFGAQCSFTHPKPDCRFGLSCQNPACPFNHPHLSGGRGGRYGRFAAPAKAPPCKFFPACHNPACQFFHPVTCKFGSRCRNPSCQYTHTLSKEEKASVPCKFGDACTKAECPFYHQNTGGPKHISDRVFVLEEETASQ